MSNGKTSDDIKGFKKLWKNHNCKCNMQNLTIIAMKEIHGFDEETALVSKWSYEFHFKDAM